MQSHDLTRPNKGRNSNTLAVKKKKEIMTSPVSSCSSDFDAAETFAGSLMDQINKEDVKNMVKTQRDMLSRFEKTNEMLINFNILSANRYMVTCQEYKKHTLLMYEMKKDLDTIFKRIRVVKQRLNTTYPDAFKVCGSVSPLLEDEEDEYTDALSRSQTVSQTNSTEFSNQSSSDVDQSTTNSSGTSSKSNDGNNSSYTDAASIEPSVDHSSKDANQSNPTTKGPIPKNEAVSNPTGAHSYPTNEHQSELAAADNDKSNESSSDKESRNDTNVKVSHKTVKKTKVQTDVKHKHSTKGKPK